ncbi:hypothetical protein ACFX2B_014112 [Malus domestica]
MIPHYWKQPLCAGIVLQDTIEIHQLNTTDIAYNLQDIEDNNSANTGHVGTDTALQNKKLHRPDNDKHLRDPSDHNY